MVINISIIAFIIVILSIIIVLFVILFFKQWRQADDNVYDLFGDKLNIEEIQQPERIPFPTHRGYNPCIFEVNGIKEPFIALRMCNFSQCPGKKNQWDSNRRYLTNSHTIILSPDNNIRYLIKHPNVSNQNCEKGIEDLRMITTKSECFLIGNATSGDICRREMYLMRFPIKKLKKIRESNILHEIEVTSITKLEIENNSDRDEKNWMPWIHENQLHFVYSINPHVILKYDQNYPKNCVEVSRSYNSNLPNDLRGGSQILRAKKWHKMTNTLSRNIKYEEEDLYIGVAHIRTSNWTYMTYIYGFENKYPFHVKYITKGFVFGNAASHSQGIQFAAGLARITENGVNYFKISYGENDCVAKICTIKEEDVMKALRKI